MNKEKICELIQNYINGVDRSFDTESILETDELDAFYSRTALRLKKTFDLYSENEKYWDDFLIALRDYLLVFDTGIHLANLFIPDNNVYAIKKNSSSGKYYCSFQFPEGVIASFAESAFMRGVASDSPHVSDYNLMTDALIYKLTGFTHFKSMSQKLAVYGALNTPPGYTTLVSLPTGGGKSLITQVMAYQSEGLTIVVVPTVSLADDQLIAAKSCIVSPAIEQEVFAYRSGVELAPILSAIHKRTARLLFISPEALINNQAFEDVIRIANKQHYLKNIIIDEAHIVVDWGASFRVDYQCLEAWRRNLINSNPMIRTILLSATYEPIAVDILKKLFSVADKWIEIRCDALRHEPRYMVLKERYYSQKDKKTIELVRKLPHPMIIYVARPDDAERLRGILVENGINNSFTYTGLTNNAQREKILKAWKNNEFEILLATSAFGVGVDKPDVRTVLHLYVPQNPNAYYQELGRGGRDQLPCLSVMCIYQEDIKLAFHRINKRVMTTEKILGRWDSMYNNKSSIRSGNVIHINTAIKPNYSTKDEWDDTPISDADMNWNIYVLLLFRRYDLINVVSITKDNGVYIFSIEIINDLLRNTGKQLFSLIDNIHNLEWGYYYNAYKTMEAAVNLHSEVCWSEMFFETYDKVNEYCAGCNNHHNINNSDKNTFALKKPIKSPLKEVLPDQRACFEGQRELVLLADESETIDVIKFLDKIRTSCLIASDQMLDNIQYFMRIQSTRNTCILGYNGAKEMLKRNNYYYFSGIIAVLYPSKENEVIKLYKMVQRYLSSMEEIYVIHVFSENVFIPSLGKNIADLINGRVIVASNLL